MDITIIKNEEQYKEYLQYLDSIFHKDMSEEEINKAALIEILIENYESKNKRVEENNLDEFEYIYSLVKGVSSLEKNADMIKKTLKLGEEFGELAAEVLKDDGYKYTEDSSQQINQNILHEGVDCLMMVLDILNRKGFTKNDIIKGFELKIDNWIYKTNNNKNQK